MRELEKNNDACDTDNIVKLLKQNQEFKELLVEQNKMMIDQQTENKNPRSS